jgi:hypothetical protein
MIADFYSERIVAARSPYRCTFCQLNIQAKQRHVYVSRCSAGTFASHRAHLACQSAADGQEREQSPLTQGASEADRVHTPVDDGSTPSPAPTLKPACTWPECACTTRCEGEARG